MSGPTPDIVMFDCSFVACNILSDLVSSHSALVPGVLAQPERAARIRYYLGNCVCSGDFGAASACVWPHCLLAAGWQLHGRILSCNIYVLRILFYHICLK